MEKFVNGVNADNQLKIEDRVIGGKEVIERANSLSDLICDGCGKGCKLDNPGCHYGTTTVKLFENKK